jgi:hypothetical protein
MRKVIVTVLMLFGLLPECMGSPSVDLSAVVEANPHGPVLRFTMKNSGDEPLAFSRAFLPWSEGLFEAPMHARFVEFPYQEFQQAHRINDTVGSVTVDPGASISGELPLNRRFIALQQNLKKGAVIVFWHWVPNPTGQAKLEPKAGWVVLSPGSEALDSSVNRETAR